LFFNIKKKNKDLLFRYYEYNISNIFAIFYHMKCTRYDYLLLPQILNIRKNMFLKFMK
jgi:hypothetical protein